MTKEEAKKFERYMNTHKKEINEGLAKQAREYGLKA